MSPRHATQITHEEACGAAATPWMSLKARPLPPTHKEDGLTDVTSRQDLETSCTEGGEGVRSMQLGPSSAPACPQAAQLTASTMFCRPLKPLSTPNMCPAESAIAVNCKGKDQLDAQPGHRGGLQPQARTQHLALKLWGQWRVGHSGTDPLLRLPRFGDREALHLACGPLYSHPLVILLWGQPVCSPKQLVCSTWFLS